MQDPEPAVSWKPSQSVVVGTAIGALIGQFIVALCNQYLSHPLSAELSSATTALCVGLGTYFIPDRK